MAGVAQQLAKTDYDTDDFKKFHEGLVYVCDYEERIYQNLSPEKQYSLEKNMLASIKQVEEELAMS